VLALIELRKEIEITVENDPKYADLRTLDRTDPDDVRKIKILEDARDAEIAAKSADIDDLSDKLKARQLRLQAAQQAQLERLNPGENIDLGEVNALVENS
jgi:hypothetical protein